MPAEVPSDSTQDTMSLGTCRLCERHHRAGPAAGQFPRPGGRGGAAARGGAGPPAGTAVAVGRRPAGYPSAGATSGCAMSSRARKLPVSGEPQIGWSMDRTLAGTPSGHTGSVGLRSLLAGSYSIVGRGSGGRVVSASPKTLVWLRDRATESSARGAPATHSIRGYRGGHDALLASRPHAA